MTSARIVVCVLLGSCSHTDGGPTATRAPEAVHAARSPDAPEANGVAACGADSDCVVRGLPDPSEVDGGACCPGCGLYEAINASSAREQPACDSQRRGVCSRSCTPTSAAPPAARCRAGRCALDYPAMDDTCAVDTDCASLPAILHASQSGPCHLACGESIAVSRTAAGWVEGLWRNPTVAGVCPADCVVPPMPDTRCVAGRCMLAPVVVVHVANAEVHDAYIDNARHAVAVEALLSRYATDFRRCSERPRRARAPGSWTFGLDFSIGADGSVTSEKPINLGGALPDITQCLDGVIRAWHFPPPDSKPPWHIYANAVLFFR